MSDSNKYTIGWVCALDCELIAARAMLDEKHDPPVTAQRDENKYYLGKMGRHNVVIAGLPDAQYGISSATAVARDMLSTFSNIRIGLMVGIGGGAPNSENDIRLGDVVVGSAKNGRGSIFQYTFGKKVQARELERTGLLNEPPNVLRTAVRSLRITHEMEGTQFETSVDAALEHLKVPRIKNRYRRPKIDSDILFRSDVVHVDRNVPCAICCGPEDPSKKVTRSAREDFGESYVHYGRIASADRVMKDAEERDRLAQEGVLCFEMEAAGLMNNFPCLVIRGICNYSDSHKNEQWQGYAALLAAAYAKQLLKTISSNQLETERRLLDVLNSVDKKIDDLGLVIKQTGSMQQRARILSWLRPPDPSINYNKAKKSRPHQKLLKSGTWLLQHETFQSWKADHTSCLLWLHGNSGYGKTVLSSTVIESLEVNEDSIVLRFYFDFTDREKQKLEHLLRSLVSQLGLLRPVCQKSLADLYSSCGEDYRQPSLDELCELFTIMIKAVDDLYIVIDALDECTTRTGDDTENVLAWLKTTIRTEQARVRVFVTSRPEEDIRNCITELNGSIRQVQIRGADVEQDISSYLDFRLRKDDDIFRWRKKRKMQDRIKASLLCEADGMFRLAVCRLDLIKDARRGCDLLDALRRLPRTLNDVYQRSLERIPNRDLPVTIRILQLLLFSPRPLTIKELSNAIAVDSTSEPCLDVTKCCEDPRDVASYCSGFVTTVDQAEYYADRGSSEGSRRMYQHIPPGYEADQSPFLQLSHLSIKEFLLSRYFGTPPEIKRQFQKEAAEMMLADVCISYLLNIPGGMKHWEVKQRYPFADYCSKSWYIFAATPRSVPDRLTDKSMKLLKKDGFHLPETESRHEDGRAPVQKWEADGLYYASFFGLINETETALSKGADVNAQGGHYGNALQAAAFQGHEEVVKSLLTRGANTSAEGGHYGNALQAAAYGGHQEVVKLLLSQGADVNAEGGPYGSALQAATCGAHVKIVELLLSRGAYVNAEGGYHDNALNAASQRSHVGIVNLLLAAGADINMQGKTKGTPLQVASRDGHVMIVKILMDRGANVNAQAGDRRNSALQDAVEAYRLSDTIVKLLLAAGADVHAQNSNSETALQLAIMRGRSRLEVADILWKAGARETAETIVAVRKRTQQRSEEIGLKMGLGKRPENELQQKLETDLKLLQEIMDNHRLK